MSSEKRDIVVEIEGLTKKYGDFKPLDNVDLKIPKGCCSVFLGPNGAGKTTLLHSILGIIKYKKGSIKIFGENSKKDYVSIYEKIGFLPENQGFQLNQTGYNLIEFTLKMRGFKFERPDKLLTQVGLRKLFWNKNIQTYSRGMKQRLGIAQAIAGDPQLIIMDEPFQNLDPVGCENLIEIIKDKVKKGVTIIFSSHVISEIEEIADYLLIINRGKIKQFGETLQIPVNMGFYNFEITSSFLEINELYTKITNYLKEKTSKLLLDVPVLLENTIFVKTRMPKSLTSIIKGVDDGVLIYPAKGVIQKIYKKSVEFFEDE